MHAHAGPRVESGPGTGAVSVHELSHSYGKRQALDRVSLDIPEGSIFGLLGPNGSGKSTLFRILSTLIPVREGRVELFGQSLAGNPLAARRNLGVVFQSPSLDPLLSARENLIHQGHLYGLRGADLNRRAGDALAMVGLSERARERVSRFSGGLRRRLEIAKSLLHEPRLLILDEPSTGLDPAARRDVWRHVRGLAEERGVTVVFTTHILEEADGADRIAVLDLGRLVAVDTPDALKASVGGDVVVVSTEDPASLARSIEERFHVPARVTGSELQIEKENGHAFIAPLVEAFPKRIDAVSLRRPDLNDVFFKFTGRRLDTVEELP